MSVPSVLYRRPWLDLSALAPFLGYLRMRDGVAQLEVGDMNASTLDSGASIQGRPLLLHLMFSHARTCRPSRPSLPFEPKCAMYRIRKVEPHQSLLIMLLRTVRPMFLWAKDRGIGGFGDVESAPRVRFTPRNEHLPWSPAPPEGSRRSIRHYFLVFVAPGSMFPKQTSIV